MKTYSRPDNPLLIPEVRKDAVTASYALYAFLHFHALCYAPFGVEDLWADQPSDLSAEVIDALKLDPLSFNLSGTKEIGRGIPAAGRDQTAVLEIPWDRTYEVFSETVRWRAGMLSEV